MLSGAAPVWPGEGSAWPMAPDFMAAASCSWMGAEDASTSHGGVGYFDATEAWAPTAQVDRFHASYDATGAWIPPAAQAPKPKDLGVEFEARLKSIIAKAKLQDAVKLVAPQAKAAPKVRPREEQLATPATTSAPSVPEDTSWSYDMASLYAQTQGLAASPWSPNAQAVALSAPLPKPSVPSQLLAGVDSATSHGMTNGFVPALGPAVRPSPQGRPHGSRHRAPGGGGCQAVDSPEKIQDKRKRRQRQPQPQQPGPLPMHAGGQQHPLAEKQPAPFNPERRRG
mmetsp:Transcript_64822/g.143097  ORF Transcript_64822/g.143097 Transcript_64822/m.143097 type:complete len:283 (-) Transcript_64822:57-905(-)